MRLISGVLVLAVSVGMALVSGSAPAGGEPAVKSEAFEQVNASGGDAGFWTEKRIEKALANDLLDGRGEGPDPGSPAPESAVGSSLRHSFVPDSVRSRAIGKLVLRYGRGSVGSCSGTLIDTPSRSLVLTAAHCLYLYRAWTKSARFLPGYDFGGGSYYSWGWKSMIVTPQWFRTVKSGRFPGDKFDIGIVYLAKPLGDSIESMPYRSNPPRSGLTRIVGYPGGAMRGKRLRMCTTPTWKDRSAYSRAFPGPPPVIGRCDMAAGSSGGPWLIEETAPDGSPGYAVKGVTSLGWKRGGGRGKVLSSPYFGPALDDLITYSER